MGESELPEAELDVMSCLWTKGLSTAREIREELHARRPMAHASVCTLLKRLEEKGYVTRQKSGVGKSYSYQAAVQPKRTARKLLDNLLDRVFGGSGVALVASLLESRSISAEEIDELEALLADLKKRKSKRRNRK